MKEKKTLSKRVLTGVAIAALGSAVTYSAATVGAADHLDAPAVQADGRTDINDLYAFQSPKNAENTVLVMTVNPGAGVISGTTFDPKADYTFNIDDDGDAVADRTISFDFRKVTERGQRFEVKIDDETVAKGRVGKTKRIRDIDAKVRAGVYDDPFFFDLNGFRDGFMFTGDDFFAGLNVSAIAIELPSNELSYDSNIGVWASTSVDGQQIDRIGRPAINTVLIPSDRKDEFNQGVPSDDFDSFGEDVRVAIAGLNGGDADTAAAITDVLLPDVLTIDTSSSAGFLNGRQLADDVIDAELDLLSSGGVITDMVDGNDRAFPNRFPYLATANNKG